MEPFIDCLFIVLQELSYFLGVSLFRFIYKRKHILLLVCMESNIFAYYLTSGANRK